MKDTAWRCHGTATLGEANFWITLERQARVNCRRQPPQLLGCIRGASSDQFPAAAALHRLE
eukprot:346090-Chlamydomonas_euryale.AAC.13